MEQFVANGLCNGSVYALSGLGFGLIFFAAKTLHIGHGAVYTAAAYACYAALHYGNYSLMVAVPAGIGAGMLLGTLIEVFVYRPLVHPRRSVKASPTVVMIASLGAYTVIVHVIALLFGHDTKVLRPGAEETVAVAGAVLTRIQVAQFLAFAVALLLLYIFLKISRFGQTVRALADDPELIDVLGHDMQRLRLVVFAIGSLLASAAGILSALDVGIDPHGGFNVFLVAAVAVIVGGVGNFLAPALGALLLGLLQSLVVWQTSAKWSNAVVFALLIVVLLVRPQGIMAKRKRMEEM